MKKNIYINLIIISIIVIFIIYNIYLYYNKEQFTSGTLCEIDKLADEFCTGKKLVDIGTNWLQIPINEQIYQDEVEITNETMKTQFLQLINFEMVDDKGVTSHPYDPPNNLTKDGYKSVISDNNVIITEKSFIKITKPGQTSLSKYVPQSAYGYNWLKLGLNKKIYEDEEEITDYGFKNIFKRIVDTKANDGTYPFDPPINLTTVIYNDLINKNKVYIGKKNFVIIDRGHGISDKYVPDDQRSGVCWWVPLDNKKVCREICPESAKEQIISKPIKIETNYKNQIMLLTERQRLSDSNSEIANAIPSIIENTDIVQQNMIDNTISQRLLESEINNSITPLIWTVQLENEIKTDDIELNLIGLEVLLNQKLQKISSILTTGDYIILTEPEWQTILWNRSNYTTVKPQKIWKKVGNTLPNDDTSNEIILPQDWNDRATIYQKFIVNENDPLSVELLDTEIENEKFPIINKNSYLKNQRGIYYVPFITYRPSYNSYVKTGNYYFKPTLWGNCSNAQKDVLIETIKFSLESKGYIDKSTLPSGSLIYKNEDIYGLCTTNNYGRQGNLDNEYITFTKLNTDLKIEQFPGDNDISTQLKNFRNSKVSANVNNNLVPTDDNYSVDMKNSIQNPSNRKYYSNSEYNTIISNWNTEKNEIMLSEGSKISSTQNVNCAYTKQEVNNWNNKNVICPSDDIPGFNDIGTWGKIGNIENTQHENYYTLNKNIIDQNTAKTEKESECFINNSTINNWKTTLNVESPLNWKNIGRFQPKNKTKYEDDNINNLIDKLRISTKFTQSQFNLFGLKNPININHYVKVDFDFYIPIVDPVILTNINDGEGETKWVYNDTDYMPLNQYKIANDNLNNFKCAYTNDRANSLNDSTITPSMISGLEDMNGMTWGKIAKESDKVGATNNYICPNDQEICNSDNLLYVIKSDLNTLEKTRQTKINYRDSTCGMTTNFVSTLGNTFEKDNKLWGRITPVNLDSDGLAPYDTNNNINNLKTECYYSLQEVDQWGNRIIFDNINYGKVGSDSDEFMLISNVENKISDECPITNDAWNQGLFIQETNYGTNIFKDFEDKNFGVVKNSQGILTSDYITNSLCNSESADNIATYSASKSSFTDTDSYRTTLNNTLRETIIGLKNQSESLKDEITGLSEEHNLCLNNLKDGDSFKISYDDYVKSKENLEKIDSFKKTGIIRGNEKGDLWKNKYSKKLSDDGAFIDTDDPNSADECKIQSIADVVNRNIEWHNVNPIIQNEGNNITDDQSIGTWFVEKIRANKYKTSFISSEIDSSLDLDKLKIDNYIVVDNKYYKPKLTWNNPSFSSINSCVDVNKICRTKDHTITPGNYNEALEVEKELLNKSRTICDGTTINDINLRGFNDYMKTYANKYTNDNVGNKCKRTDSVNTSYTDKDTCSNAYDGTLQKCITEESKEDCCTKENSDNVCLPNTNITLRELNNNIHPIQFNNNNGTFSNSFTKNSMEGIKDKTESELTRYGLSDNYISTFDEARNRFSGGKCKINSGESCFKTTDTIPSLVWKKINKDSTHIDSNKMQTFQIINLINHNDFVAMKDIITLTIEEFNNLGLSEKQYINNNQNRWININGNSSKVYVLDHKYNNIINCKPEDNVDISLYTTPKPNDQNDFCSNNGDTCTSAIKHNTKSTCLDVKYNNEVEACDDMTKRCDFNHLVINNCKTNNKSATGLAWYIISDSMHVPYDQKYKLNLNNEFDLLKNKLETIYLSDNSIDYINLTYQKTQSPSSSIELYLNESQYQDYILKELKEPLTSDHYIVINDNTTAIYFKAIPSWSHTLDYDGLLDPYEYKSPIIESCNDNLGITEFANCNKCPSGYYRTEIDKESHLIGHPENGSLPDHTFSDLGYNIKIWKDIVSPTKNNIKEKIINAVDKNNMNYILDIIEDNSNTSYADIEVPVENEHKHTMIVFSSSYSTSKRTRIKEFPSGGYNTIMYISGYINIDKTAEYSLDIAGTKIGYKVWINGIPIIQKFPTNRRDDGDIDSNVIYIVKNNFYHFEAILFNHNKYHISGNYFDVSLTNIEIEGAKPEKLKLYLNGINPWCGTCVKCGGCTNGQIRENCGLDDGTGDDYSEGTCTDCGTCNNNGNFNI